MRPSSLAGPVSDEGTEDIVAIITEEPAPPSEAAADDVHGDDQPGEEDKPA